MARITHPTMPGSDVEVPDVSLPHYRESGWLVIGEDIDGPAEAPAPLDDEAAEGAGDGAADAPADPPVETKTPKARRATVKDGD